MNTRFPWYDLIETDDLEQGDIIDACPVSVATETDSPDGRWKLKWEERDLIVLSQLCDLVKGREKVSEVRMSAVWKQSELTGHLATHKGMEDARRGNLPGVHLLAASDFAGAVSEIRVVDFRRLSTLPLDFLRKQILTQQCRLRLLPPYREHLSQAFARFFMRVGLPIDIPPFR
ncbi:MAG TPA: hypothetical protein VK137_14270 [Planctomycetaceae bacterium]|nr:hypothetical protein [Planctomycetaceae bacterium]